MVTRRHPLTCGATNGFLAVAAALLASPLAAAAPQPPQNRTGTIRHVHLAGDIDSMRVVSLLDEQINTAAKVGATLILLELDGNRWRSDAVWSVAQKIRQSPIPFAAYLSDTADRTVGAGQLIVGLLATECFVESGTAVRGAPGDDLRELVPESTDLEQVTREMSGALYTRLGELGAPPDLADVLVNLSAGKPQPLLWAMFEPATKGTARLQHEDPVAIIPGTRSVPIVTRAFDGTPRLNIPSDAAVHLRLAGAPLPSSGAVSSALGHRAGIKSRARIESGLSEARTRTGVDLDAFDSLAERAKAVLELPDPPDAAVSPDRYRRAAQSALEEIDSARALLSRTEQALADYPELLLGPAPGQTSVGGRPSVFASRWRSAVQSRRDRLDKLEARARLFAGR